MQKDLESFKEMNRNEQKDFLLFKDLKNELEKNNISIQNFEQLINIITIFKNDFKYQPSKILNEFSGIQEYRRQRDNKNIELNNLEWNIQKLRSDADFYKLRISGYQLEELALLDLQNMGFNLADLKKLYLSLQYVAQKYSIDVKEAKTKFFKFVDKFQDLFSLETKIGEKETESDILDQKIISNREILKGQPETLSVLKCLVDTGFDENNILSVFQIFKKDFLKRYPIYLKTYLQDLSKDLDKYINVKNSLKNLHVQELLMKCRVDKLSVEKSHIENFIYSSFIVFYFMHISISIQHARMQKRFTEYLVLQYVVYLFFYNIVKKNLMVSKRKLKTRNKKTT